jgi:hypothetical protein
MPCLFALFAVFTPRIADIIFWIARPTMFTAAFGGSWFWPLLGIIFLPFTTLIYALLWRPAVGLTGLDWMWVILAFLCDLMHYGSSAYYNRNKMPGYVEPSAPTGPSVPGPSGS